MMTEPAASSRTAEPLLRCEDLMVRFIGRDSAVHAVNGVSFTLDAGEVLCILGESGSGKSVTLRAMMRLLPARITRISGRVGVAGRNVLELDQRSLATCAARRWR
jgi:peptide/nickel transport system ATP-binding protein